MGLPKKNPRLWQKIIDLQKKSVAKNSADLKIRFVFAKKSFFKKKNK